MSARSSSRAFAGFVGAASLFLVAHWAGFIPVIGYEAASLRQVGGLTTGGPWNITAGMPVRLGQGETVEATYDIDAKFGAVVLTVCPPIFWRTPLQAARFYIEGQKTGTVRFVARSAGWYTFYASASPLGGPRCNDGTKMLRADPSCPTYDVRYRVTWRRPDGAAQAEALIEIPKPGETLVTARVR